MKERAQQVKAWFVWLYNTRPVQAIVNVVQEIIWRYGRDDAGVLAAGLAFYAIISIAPLALFLIMLAGLLISRETAQATLLDMTTDYFGTDTALQVEQVLANTSAPRLDSLTALVTIGVLAFGATRIFAQLQVILNRTFSVRTRSMGIWDSIKFFLRKRLVAAGLLAGVAALMLASLIFNAIMGAAQNFLPADMMQMLPVQNTVNFFVATLTGGVMMAVVFRTMPDAVIAWRDVFIGGLFTSTLFNLGQRAIEWYLARETLGSSYGAAGSLVLLLLWLYYSSTIFLIGAEFTDTWARLFGKGVKPGPHAIAILGQDRLEHERFSMGDFNIVDLAEAASRPDPSQQAPPLGEDDDDSRAPSAPVPLPPAAARHTSPGILDLRSGRST